MKRLVRDPRPTLAAYGAPLAGYAPKKEMELEEAVARALLAARGDHTVALVLPVVLLKNAGKLRMKKLRALAASLRVRSELGMMLDLSDDLRHDQRLHEASKDLPRRRGAPRYFPRLLGGKYEQVLADRRTPEAVARWGFRMNATREDLRGFVDKHLG